MIHAFGSSWIIVLLMAVILTQLPLQLSLIFWHMLDVSAGMFMAVNLVPTVRCVASVQLLQSITWVIKGFPSVSIL